MAAGHPVTLAAALSILDAGGNAFDAVAAALAASFAAEPLLSSPGGGGFLLARPAGQAPRILDFFTHTPLERLPAGREEDFREVHVDFGGARQAFHIGLGSVATPGVIAGLFAAHGDLGRMPMTEVMEPAVAAARSGVRVTAMQGYLASVLEPIFTATPGAARLHAPGGRPVAEGDTQRLPELADLLETLAIEGEDLFYRGEVAAAVARASEEQGGHLRREDFERYAALPRTPLETTFRGATLWTNPPPASGGVLVAFGLAALAADPDPVPPDPMGEAEARRLARALVLTAEARLAEGLEGEVDLALARRFLDPETLARYVGVPGRHPPAPRGTTHVSVVDRAGNAASLSVSNGEGCGWAVPGAGFMLNNMLGEADLQPAGFGRWPTGVRLTSMMAPTLLAEPDGRIVALGSGGSSRIRSALLQVISGIVDQGLPLDAAVARPRLHVESSRLEIEGGWPEGTVAGLAAAWPDHAAWPAPNLFFGGVHAVEQGPRGCGGAGDPRRGGVSSTDSEP